MTAASAPDGGGWRWTRLAVIALAAVILASCRSLTAPPAAPLAAAMAVTAAGARPPCPEVPCRAEPLAADGGRCVAAVVPVPQVMPCLVCDGGDQGAPARPSARLGLAHLTSGDTVARYRAADDHAEDCDVRIVASNCTCVYAPRFGSVRQVTTPHEDARPLAPRGFAVDDSVMSQVDLQPVRRTAQAWGVEAARRALPGVAIEERLGPLAVDQGHMPYESDGLAAPAEDVRDDRLEKAELVQRPRLVVGFDVPLAWTSARAAMVTVGTRRAEVVAADRGTATLRLESPGRAELTLCKRAGSDTARVGEELDFTIYFLNSGDRALTDIVLADALPGRLTLVSDSAAANLPAAFATGTGEDGSVVLTWTFRGTLAPGDGGFVRFRTTVR